MLAVAVEPGAALPTWMQMRTEHEQFYSTRLLINVTMQCRYFAIRCPVFQLYLTEVRSCLVLDLTQMLEFLTQLIVYHSFGLNN